MARRKDIAGLAALGALGMMLSNKGGSDGEKSAPMLSDDQYNPDVKYAGLMEQKEPGWDTPSGAAPSRSSGKPSGLSTPRSKRLTGDDQYNPDVRQGRVAGQGGPRGTRYNEAGMGSAGQKGPGFGEEAAYRQQQYEAAQAQANTPKGRAERQAKAESQALGQVRPEEYVIGAPMSSVKAVANMARGLAKSRGGEKLAEYSQPAIGYAERKLLTGGGDRALLEAPPRRLTGPSAQTASRSGEVADSGREAVTNPMAWTGGPKSMREIQAMEDAARARRGMSEMDTTGGAIGYKRGGMTKKSAMSSKPAKMTASSRGDGIAMRGKTRGMMR